MEHGMDVQVCKLKTMQFIVYIKGLRNHDSTPS